MKCSLVALSLVAVQISAHGPAAQSSSDAQLLSLALQGWKINRELLRTGSGSVFLDLEDASGKSGRHIRLMFDGPKQRQEPALIPFESDRKRTAVIPDVAEKDVQGIYVEFGEGCFEKRHPISINEVSITKAGSTLSHRLYETVSVDDLMGNLLIESREKWNANAAASQETVDGVRLVRIDEQWKLDKDGEQAKLSVWLDPAKGFAMTRSEYGLGGYRSVRRCRLEQVAGGAWFPVVAEAESYEPDKDNKPVLWYRGRWTFSQSFKFNEPIEPGWFRLDSLITNGGLVRDRRVYPPLDYTFAPPFKGQEMDQYLDEMQALIARGPGKSFSEKPLVQTSPAAGSVTKPAVPATALPGGTKGATNGATGTRHLLAWGAILLSLILVAVLVRVAVSRRHVPADQPKEND